MRKVRDAIRYAPKRQTHHLCTFFATCYFMCMTHLLLLEKNKFFLRILMVNMNE